MNNTNIQSLKCYQGYGYCGQWQGYWCCGFCVRKIEYNSLDLEWISKGNVKNNVKGSDSHWKSVRAFIMFISNFVKRGVWLKSLEKVYI